MPYSSIFVDGDFTKLKQGFDTLVDNGIVGSVVLDTSGSYPVITLYTDSESTTEFFKIEAAASGYNNGTKYTLTATNSDGNTVSHTTAVTNDNTKIYNYKFGTLYTCENGVMFNCSGTSQSGTYLRFWIIITSNQDGSPVVVWNTTSTTATEAEIKTLMNTEFILCASDTGLAGTNCQISRTAPAYRDQTVISPFFANSSAGTTSYTPNAGRIIAGNVNNLILWNKPAQISFGGALWLTNGYWAFKVG